MQLKKYVGFLGCAFLISTSVKSQPYTLNKNIKPIELNLIEYKKTGKDSIWNGKINLTAVKPTKDTMYFVVKGASIYQPNKFTLSAKSKKVIVTICKNSWKSPDKSGNTQNGKYSTDFKTEGSYGIMVVSKDKAPYQMFIWNGKPVKPKDIFSKTTKK